MLDWTDRHCRRLHRIITPHARLYTEMITTGALIHGPRERLLAHSPEEYPLAIQLGGNDPKDLQLCARMAEDAGYQEVNLNVGCPSDRVQSGAFGACLMKTPEVVAEAVSAMQASVSIPVTVKHRLGVDDFDSPEFLHTFMDTVASAGCEVFIVHARKAWLQGLSPKENRDIPPLRHEEVVDLKQRYPHLTIITNGGLKSVEDCQHWLNAGIDGVMIGRWAYQSPMQLGAVDHALFPHAGLTPLSAHEVVARWLPYLNEMQSQGNAIKHMARHGINLFQNRPGAKQWRRWLSENLHQSGATSAIIEHALTLVPDLTLATDE